VSRLVLLVAVALLVMRVVRFLLAPGARRPAADGGRRWDPYAVLGITRGASHDQIVRAYREQVKLYHPDRVADLGPELQQVAHQKTVELQRAYTELTREASPAQ
jgi:preprotein translocase subunit Sec63